MQRYGGEGAQAVLDLVEQRVIRAAQVPDAIAIEVAPVVSASTPATISQPARPGAIELAQWASAIAIRPPVLVSNRS